jgi:hypothetical protein
LHFRFNGIVPTNVINVQAFVDQMPMSAQSNVSVNTASNVDTEFLNKLHNKVCFFPLLFFWIYEIVLTQ